MFDKVLIANRGVIVVRILRTLKKLGVKSVVVYAEADRNAPYISDADEAYSLGPGAAAATYLDSGKLIEIALKSGAKAVHPGYGFLSENAQFIDACTNAGLIWLGPTAEQIREFGYKHRARELATEAGVALVPGTPLLETAQAAKASAEAIGYPVMLKSTAGGGGIGMQICEGPESLDKAFDSVRNSSQRNFGDGGVFLEAYISNARHIEVQLFGDGEGQVVALGERDCSTQRRNQKVIEESPAPRLSDEMRTQLHETAVRLGKLVRYRSAGTVEFILDSQRQEFYFLEVNTRLQVEHGVTELVWGVDIVEWMIRLGAGELSSIEELASHLSPSGYAIQARLYAEDPFNNFRPSAGLLTEVEFPPAEPGLRIDHALKAGLEITALFDPMLAKVIVYDPASRENACKRLASALDNTRIYGIILNCDWLAAILHDKRFIAAEISTRWLLDFKFSPTAFEVLKPGTFTSVQDYPGRKGHWDVGVPPSGPFDDWSFQLGNRLLGNHADAAGLECTLAGPTIRFLAPVDIVIAGEIEASIDGVATRIWEVVSVKAGCVLSLGKVTSGMRAYLLVKGGIQCPKYLGSRSTFTLGQFGGHAGRTLLTSDRLYLAKEASQRSSARNSLDMSLRPRLTHSWEIAVSYGPHGSPDFFTSDDIDTIFSHRYEVHFNSSRTGVRLSGPRPTWARTDGGEAGLHPSNIHDNAYAFGTLDFTGDMPIILGPDGPSLGGFVCPATVVRAERWKIGQLRPGDTVKFVPIKVETARHLEESRLSILEYLKPTETIRITPFRGSPVVREIERGVKIVYRKAGDDFLLIEFGPMELDIAIRFRVHAWTLWLQEHTLDGIQELTPGIRSLQIHYDPLKVTLTNLLKYLESPEVELTELDSLEVESREISLPLSWDDEACREAIDKYQRVVRPDAPWCPSNLEFIRRINGLTSIEEVQKIVFEASYLVLGLGDVYLGAPVATPLDPTQRLVTTKYNPARTWTAENSVGIGGAYLCVYGMEGPGGYQFVGRTLQMWNRYGRTTDFERPWLLRYFDQIRFHPVSHDDLMAIRSDFPQGRYHLQSKPVRFRLSDYLAEQEKHKDRIMTFKQRRLEAFNDEIAAWRANGQFTFDDTVVEAAEDDTALEPGESSIDSPVSGSIWKVLVKPGEKVKAEQVLAIVESMKMEISVAAQSDCIICRVPIKEGATVSSGQSLVVVKE